MSEPALRVNVEDVSVCASLFHGGAEVSIADAVRYMEGEDVWLLTRVNVHRKHRRQGHGRALVQGVVQSLRRHGARALIVAPGGYDTPDEVKLAFFAALGFRSNPEGYLELDVQP